MFWPIIGLKCRFRAAAGGGHTFAPGSHKNQSPQYQTQGVPRAAPTLNKVKFSECIPLAVSKCFDRARSTFYTGGMEVKLSPELQAKLDSIAAQQGRDSASLVHEAVERLIGYDEWFMRQVEAGLAQIDRGEVLEHDEVAARMEKLIAEKQRRS
jgi:predicted transcriptional regulator